MKLLSSVSWIAPVWVLAYLQLLSGIEGGFTFLQNTLDTDPILYEGITTLSAVMNYSYPQMTWTTMYAYLYESNTNAAELGSDAIYGQTTGQSSFSMVISEQNVYDLDQAYIIDTEKNVTSIDDPYYIGFQGFALKASGDFALAFDTAYGNTLSYTSTDDGKWTSQYLYYGPTYGDTIAMSANGARVVSCMVGYSDGYGLCSIYNFYPSSNYFSFLVNYFGE